MLEKVRKPSLKQFVHFPVTVSRDISFPSMRITSRSPGCGSAEIATEGLWMRNERFALLEAGLYASVIIFVAELRCVKYEPIVNESARSPFRAPRRHPCPSLPIASTLYSSDTESADAESNSGEPKSIPRWPTTPWPSLQLNPFAASNANVAVYVILLVSNVFKY